MGCSGFPFFLLFSFCSLIVVLIFVTLDCLVLKLKLYNRGWRVLGGGGVNILRLSDFTSR